MIRSSFEKNLDTATSHLRLDIDWPTTMKICDDIRQNDVVPKTAVSSIKKKMQSPNPHTAFYACCVLESVVKNCGSPIHDEIATTVNCEFFANLINQTKHDNVRAKMLELIQTWAFAFRSTPKYTSIKDTMNILKAEGHKFPELKESDAMFSSDTAPEWADGGVCHRCRVSFSLTNRKHHCRNCGQVFCGKCTTKTSTIPKYGIEKEVRVCDSCYTQLQRPSTTTATRPRTGAATESELPVEYLSSSLAQQNQGPPRRTEQELQEEEELQLAIALSQSEAEHKTKSHTPYVAKIFTPKSPSPEPVVKQKSPSPVEEINDPELARYLNRGYWENRKTTDSPASPSAPSPMSQQSNQAANGNIKEFPEDLEIDEFTSAMKGQLEIFVNRMKSNSSRGRSISTDSSVQTLFMTITSLHSKLLNYTKDMDDKRLWYEQLQDKLNQIKDSRAALDVLRQEHQEKLRRQAEEQERLRQFQMAQKLDIMRKKKQEYLQYQRQIALQRIQEQEREMQMRQEQQKAQYRIGTQSFPFMGVPSMPGAPQMAGPQHGSPLHQMPGGAMYANFNYNQQGAMSRFVTGPGGQPQMFGPPMMQHPSGMMMPPPSQPGVLQQPQSGMIPQQQLGGPQGVMHQPTQMLQQQTGLPMQQQTVLPMQQHQFIGHSVPPVPPQQPPHTTAPEQQQLSQPVVVSSAPPPQTQIQAVQQQIPQPPQPQAQQAPVPQGLPSQPQVQPQQHAPPPPTVPVAPTQSSSSGEPDTNTAANGIATAELISFD